jgi:DNA-binding XRE family transcriptional regulator
MSDTLTPLRLGAFFAKAREKKGLSRHAAAVLADLDHKTIGYIEDGRRIPALRLILALCRLYDVHVLDALVAAGVLPRSQVVEA